MEKRIYISADYSIVSGDREVVEILKRWGQDNLHKVNFIDMAQVISGSVSENPDCRPCDLKAEFNRQINASSIVIFIIGDNTANRMAGSTCPLAEYHRPDFCTPYKGNANGRKYCKYTGTIPAIDDVGNVNNYSYIQHEFRQAEKKDKSMIILYNSLRKENRWLPHYMEQYANLAQPFWVKNYFGEKVGNYSYIKKALGYE